MIRRAAVYLALGGGALVAAFPFFWMVVTSFKDVREAMAPELVVFPERWLWRNYIEAFQAAPFGTYFFNTFLVAGVTTAAVALTALCAGYAFARIPFRGRGPAFAVLLATMMIPFEAVLIPNFVLVTRLGWYDAYAALIVPWCANAFSIFLMRQAFATLPDDYFDAARVDGCGHLRFLLTIGVALVRPTLVTVVLFAFLASYNGLLWPLVVTSSESMRVVQVGLTVFSGAEGVRFHLLMCASVIVIAPTVFLYFLAQRYFLESAVATGIKM